MKGILRFVAALIAGTTFCALGIEKAQSNAPAKSQTGENRYRDIFQNIHWTTGPAKADLESIAEVQIPAGYALTGRQGTREIMEAMGNITSGKEVAFLAPTNLAWFVVFRFNQDGYVKDDDKDKLNPDSLLAAIRSGTEVANRIRSSRGGPEMRVIGWEQPPRYNEKTHNLEWGVRGESEGQPVVNFNTRLLGRRGVMEAKLVVDPSVLSSTMGTYETVLKGYNYKSGQGYADFRNGDQIAKYGLAALITGGAAAVALKTGALSAMIILFKKSIKLVVAGIVALVAAIKRLVFGKTRQQAT